MEIRKFSEVFGKNQDFEKPIMQEALIDQTFVIESVRFGQSQFGEYSVIEVNGEEYRTGSQVLCDQLHKIKDDYENTPEAGKLQVTLTKVKNYFTFG